MKWLFCLSTLCLGLLTGRLANHWLRSDAGSSSASASGSSDPPVPAGGVVTASPDGKTAWNQLMERARTDSLQDMNTVIQRGKSGPLDYLGAGVLTIRPRLS
ncbi:MAG: hypothetical protein EOO38_21110 [Cytophagaceae bacterium]|nr:MAG: hypothetical protein EOO38_21110 [Cytophagaceae bacterium]